MSRQHDVEHSLDINEVYILLKLVRNAVDRQIKGRPESISEPDWFDEALHKLSEKLERCHSGILYENPH